MNHPWGREAGEQDPNITTHYDGLRSLKFSSFMKFSSFQELCVMKITWLKRKYLLRHGEHVNACMPIHTHYFLKPDLLCCLAENKAGGMTERSKTKGLNVEDSEPRRLLR